MSRDPGSRDADGPTSDAPLASATAADVDEAAFGRQVLHAQVGQVYGRLHLSAAWTIGAAVIVLAGMRSHFEWRSLLAWGLVIISVQVGRFALYHLHARRADPAGTDSRFWERWFTVAAGAAGTAWSLGPVLLLAGADPSQRVLLLVGVVGVCAIAAIQLSPLRSAMTAFITAALLPTAGVMLAVPTVADRAGGLALLAMWTLLMVTGRHAWRNNAALIRTQARLAASLAASDAARGELEYERQRLAHIIDGSEIGTTEWHRDADHVTFNARFAQMLGYAEADLQPMDAARWQSLLAPDERRRVLRLIDAFIASRQDRLGFEATFLRRDGTPIWVKVSSRVLGRDPDGQPRVLAGTYLDFTARKREEQRWRTRAEMSADWFWETDSALKVSYLSEGTGTGALPIANERIIGRTLADVAEFHPVDRSWRDFAGALQRGESFHNFLLEIRVDGVARCVVALDGRPRLDARGRFAGYEGAGRDVTERTQATRQLRDSLALVDQLFETIPVGVVLKDVDGHLLRWNRAYHAMVGDLSTALPPSVEEQTDAVAASLHRQVDAQLLAQPGTRRYEVRQRLANGRVIDSLVHKATLLDAGGAVSGLVGTVIDISEQKAAALAFEQARDAAEQANRAKSFFLATMSHELRTPLNAVIGAAQLLRDSGDDPAQRVPLLEAIENSGASLLGLIENIMDLSRIEAGSLRLGDEPFDLIEAVESAVATAAVAARHKHVAVACIVEPGVVGWRRGDPLRVRQMVLNLLGNAVKFTPAGEVVVRVAAAQAPRVGVVVSVSDTGIGIPEDALPHIFEPFRQADEGTTRRFGGSGLGLAIVQELVQAMGGSVSVTSAPGRGTCFEAHLPLTAADRPASEAFAGDEPSALAGLPVVWYEPHGPSAEALQAYLARAGCRAVRCEDVASLRGQIDALPPGAWFLCAADGPLAVDLVGAAADRLDPDRVIGMSPGTTRADDAARESLGLQRSLVKPVLRATLVSRMAAAGQVRVGAPPVQGFAADDADDAPSRLPRVLLVEDDPTNRIIVGAMLESDGYDVQVAVDGRSAIRMVAHGEVDLVLMDWQMPDIDGLEVTRRLRAGEAGPKGRLLPIIGLTANAFAEDRTACLQAGMDDFLTKPVQIDRLLATVARWGSIGVGGASRPTTLATPRSLVRPPVATSA